MARCLVTGHKGYIGSRLFERLQELGHDVRGVDLQEQYPKNIMDFLNQDHTANFHPAYWNFKPEYIFHLASKATVKMDGNEPFDIIQDNILSTQKICQWSPKGSRVVLASSVIVYGDWMFQQESPRPYTEEDRTEPTSIYGMTKRASEGSIRYHNSTDQINGVSARMCATVGRGLTHGVVYDFIRKIYR